jgi:hypothetical protein
MRGCLALASHTGWPLSELEKLTIEELVEWCGLLPRHK